MYTRQMPVDQNLVAQASTAASRVSELEDQLEEAKTEYWLAVRRLHLAGASMREVADALGISHQRVHQIIDDGGVRRWRRRRRQDATVQQTCSFCGREQRQVRKLVAGPAVYICDPCIMAAVGVSTSGRASEDPVLHPVPDNQDFSCSFCGKRRNDVQGLIAGAGPDEPGPPTICDECLGLCGEILSKELRSAPTTKP